ncbi:putative P-loop containing nucleoside triphosphate hydrolase, leucine-rich repeat domain, L [Medicago truncatula]|uniref:Disease resistance protein (CC-NBS-LRR class) family protein n=1 Tax=Medicago truncatula TaxID=3880 RepID=A0A072TW48_MEDTR|nr:putative disease resistance protein At1g50180 [Medicago truncatula]XP_024626311.1 putative disease resistance protein At1g50180 [Medicago truncatula]KEH21734.1 disease resistance protein (CC-NBS-LRR class) family protein [Medicago truncatula]RHN44476.1 putative P-loop containing nucleoside triphosphate hydrolase, leucine-rich repeat domain, L [Medicago truncatula]
MFMVESVVSFTIERIADLLIEEASLSSGVSDQIKKLEIELKRMQCFLRDAERKQDEGGETIKNWISEIRKLAYDAEDVIETYAIKVSFSGAMTPFYKLRHDHKVGNKIISINSQIADLTRSLQAYGLTATTRDNEESHFVIETRRQLRWSYSHVVEEVTVGLDKDIKKVVKWLLNQDQHCQMVYVCGMGGLGKTTLAKNVYHYSSIRRHFEGFAWAYISQKCNRREVWEGILLQLTASSSKEERDEIRNMRDEELAKKLYKVQQEKMCLIVLDDIWSNETWDILSPAFPSKNAKSKMVFTSRNKGVSSHVDSKGLVHEPGFLNAEDSWSLFQKKAFSTSDDPEFKICNEFERLGRDMVAKCAGLPLAIIVLGGLLATKETINEWEMIHKHITSYLIKGDVPERQSRLAEVLDLSYHNMPYQLKPCFLYLSQFPEDFEIPKNKLIQLWMAEGFVSSQYEIERDERLEDVAERYLGSLISRCMVQVGQMGSTGKIKTCRLHDLMRDMCLSKARKEHFLSVITRSQKDSNSINDVSSSSSNLSLDSRKTGGVRRIALFLDKHVDKLVPPNEQVSQHLRSLVYFNDKKCRVESWKLLKTVFENFKLLRVLDLEGVKGSKGQLLPKEVGNLFWLKFLSLKRTCIQILPSSLGKLENLQSLNLQTINKVSWDSTVEIPNIIWKLKRLRHLYLPNWCGNVPGILQLENLINLQTLVNFPASKCDVSDLLKLKKLRKLVLNDPRCFQNFSESFTLCNQKLECLESLSLKTDLLSFPDQVVDVEKLVLGCPSLHKLHVEGRMERLPEAQLFPPQLSKLTLWGCKLVEDPMVTLEKLPNLKYLSGWEMYVGKKMVCSVNGFPKLEVLAIRGFSNLEEWVVENEAMPHLCRLSISDCNKLKSVPDGLTIVAGLRELEIRWMPKSFKIRLGIDGEDYHKVQHVPSIVFFN